jgi:tRNA A-37 threonylcarbamoyl transferase component Bud32
MPASSFRIGRYEIKSPIGGGGMGSLYLARDPNTGRLVALKLLRAHLDSDELKARFAREAQALASLNHPNIVDIYDSGQYRGSPFIVMEYVRGETLGEKIKRNVPLTLSQKLRLISELCAGLHHAHETGVIHRDIKPANLMVDDRQKRLKIVDFGIARVTEGLTKVGVQMTQLNMQIGTPGYMSPEQHEGADIDARSDVFAVGAVLYEVLTYREAFPGNTTRQIEKKVMQEQPAPLDSIIPGLDPGLQAIVNRALEKDANRRFQTAAEFEEALEDQRSRLVTETPAPAAAKPTPAPGQAPPVKLTKAEAAYQRCLEVYGDGATETAKRFAIEALAEDPSHAGAREILQKLDPHRRALTPAPATRPPSRSEAAATALSHGSDSDPTMIAGADRSVFSGVERTMISGAERTMLSGGAGTAEPWAPESHEWSSESEHEAWSADEEATIVAPARSTARRSSQSRRVAAADQEERRFPWATVGMSAGVVVLIAAAVGITVYLIRPWERGYELTILKPEGGTISTTGLTCGSGGTACATNFEEGRVLEFQAKADEGFTFAGYTGDCAPGGRTMMTGPRSCGATFVAAPKEAEKRSFLLNVAPTSGGTVVGLGIKCGTQGKECSVQHPEGTMVQLTATADTGFRLNGFTGDCSSKGTAVMSAPLTCGATFLPMQKLSTKGGEGSGGGTTGGGTTGGGTTGGGTTGGGTGGGANTGGGGGRPGGGTGLTGGGTTGNTDPGGGGGGGGTTASTGGGGDGGAGARGGGAKEGEKVKPPISAEAHAQAEIEKTLKAYSAAYESLSFESIQRLHPATPNIVRTQLRQYKSMELAYAGAIEFKDVDPEAGRALVQVGFKRVIVPTVGQKVSNEGKVTFTLHRRNDNWLIDQANWEVKK